MRVALLAFVAGCWLLQQQGGLPDTRLWLWLAVACAAGVIACMVLVAMRQRVPRIQYVQWCLGAATVGMIGFAWAAWRAEVRIDRWLAPEMAGRDLVVEGVVAGLPDVAEHGTRFVFNAERWCDDPAGRVDAARDRAMPARLLLTWRERPDQADRLQPGQRYRLTVRLRRPRGLANPHGFDYGYWLLAEGIDATGYARTGTLLAGVSRQDDGADAASQARIPWAVRIAMWRADIRDHLRAVLAPDARYGPVLIALVIGDQRGIAQADWEIFRRTGISHLVSISGLHITMIAGVAGALARWLWRHSFGLGKLLCRPLPLVWPAQHAALVVTVLAAFGYGLVAGMQIPALRTVTMLTVAAVALWGGRAPPVSVVLAWAAAVALAIDPWAVMAPGFWLSFGAVAVIFLHAHDDASAPDARSARGDGHRKPGRLMRMKAGIVGAARTQWAVTIGLVPLTLLLFGQVSVVSGVANAVAIPVVSLLVTPLALAGAVLPEGLARLALGIAHVALQWLVDGLAWLAAPTWAVWEAAHPRWWVTALALLGVVLALSPGMRGLQRWCGVLLMVPMLLAGRAPVAYGETRVTVLDIGQGNAVLVETGSHALLYDTGPAYASGASAGGQVIVPYLRAAGIRALDMLMISHEDADHAGGVRDVLRAVPVAARLTAAPLGHRMLGGSAGWQHCVGGAGWDWDGVRFDILHPSADELSAGRLRSNARSCVLRIATAHRSVLLTGDIGEREELRLVEREAAAMLRADILLVPHHGSGTSSHATFLRAVQPEMAMFQLGFANRYRHPRADVWRRYERAGVARYRTDETGALSISTHGNAYQVVPYRQQNRRYWRDAPPAPR